MKNITITLAQKYGYFYILWGLGYVVAGLAYLSANSTVVILGSLTNLLTNLLFCLGVAVFKSEIDDERSRENLKRSQSIAFMLTLFIANMVAYLYKFSSITIKPEVALFLVMGIGLALCGSGFLYFEKEGF